MGFNNTVLSQKIVAIAGANAAPIKRLKDQAGKENRLVDATNGKKTKSVIITDSNHVILSALAPETLSLRAENSVDFRDKK